MRSRRVPSRFREMALDVGHRWLLATAPRGRPTATATRLWATAWDQLWRTATLRWSDEAITTNLHGHPATINFANPYPLFVRRFRNYNAPQVEAVLATASGLGRSVHVLDVGAATGDTALLVLARCAGKISSLTLVEGESAFASLLRRNLRGTASVIHEVMLGAQPGPVPRLIRDQHPGTASAVGTDQTWATTLDDLIPDLPVDVVKVDADGYDGPILYGGRSLLARSKPTVLFEWHPKLCLNVGTDDEQAFTCLSDIGYDRFIFFNKYGQFSHFGIEHLNELRRLCLTSSTLEDWHYDVIALHRSSPLSAVGCANLTHWEDAGYP